MEGFHLALHKIKEDLHLKLIPSHIECFDNSNLHEILNRFQNDVINKKPNTVIILAGINDIASHRGGNVDIASIGLILGFIVMMILDVSLG